MKIGVFGGSFNPPHKLHLRLALALINKRIVDKIIYVPNLANPYHNKNLVDSQHRYNMVKLLIDNYPNLEVSDIDIIKDKPSYSYQTLDELQILYPNDELYLIIGSDNLKEIEHWGKYQYLVSTYKIIVIKRGDDDIKSIVDNNEFLSDYQKNIIPFFDFETSSLSSTIIRDKLCNHQDIDSDLPDTIYKYIKENNLYET